jgi:hypothetical protein
MPKIADGSAGVTISPAGSRHLSLTLDRELKPGYGHGQFGYDRN